MEKTAPRPCTTRRLPSPPPPRRPSPPSKRSLSPPSKRSPSPPSSRRFSTRSRPEGVVDTPRRRQDGRENQEDEQPRTINLEKVLAS
ncbi:unnamed protein product [Miscanthus lutarioriparius]|uniref:Uncharacterized protein n=1 Tax=Miscanthus lutarioriparius TaxID=422564 RepID=A0A811NCX6_9POAL|nr:unnamed protein product [Miscanthus lutarioriparius]